MSRMPFRVFSIDEDAFQNKLNGDSDCSPLPASRRLDTTLDLEKSSDVDGARAWREQDAPIIMIRESNIKRIESK
jgi:hypothetical protein